jgi:hypothetical protein
MQVSGLVITLEPGATPGSVRAFLDARADVIVGEARERWLAVAVEAPDEAGSRALHDWLRTVPGVAYVDVVHVSFEPDDGMDENRQPASGPSGPADRAVGREV